MSGYARTGSLRIVIVVTATVVIAIASFTNIFALAVGVAAAGVAGGLIIIVLLGALTSLVRERARDVSLTSNHLPTDQTR